MCPQFTCSSLPCTFMNCILRKVKSKGHLYVAKKVEALSVNVN